MKTPLNKIKLLAIQNKNEKYIKSGKMYIYTPYATMNAHIVYTQTMCTAINANFIS